MIKKGLITIASAVLLSLYPGCVSGELTSSTSEIDPDAGLQRADQGLIHQIDHHPNGQLQDTVQYQVTVNQGKGSGLYAQGELVSIEASMIEGEVFTAWTGDIQLLIDPSAIFQTFAMPAQHVTLTASYRAMIPKDCEVAGVNVPHGASQTFYSQSVVAYGQSCDDVAQERTCQDGALSGDASYDKIACQVTAASDCIITGVTVAHGQARTFYSQSVVAYGQSCDDVAQERTCQDGALSGDAQFAQLSCVARVTDAVLRKVIHDDPAMHNAFPRLTRLDDTRLAVIFTTTTEHFNHDNVGYIQMSVSPDNGWNWNPPVTIRNRPDWATAIMGFGKTDSGRLMIAAGDHFYHPSTERYDREFYHLYSDDSGATWQKTPQGSYSTFPYGGLIQVGSDLLMTAYYGVIKGAGYLISHDNGMTWPGHVNIMPYVKNSAGLYDEHYVEPAILPISGGGLLAIIRGSQPINGINGNHLFKAVSYDSGATWTDPVQIFRGLSPDLLRLQSGKILLCFADRDATAADPLAGAGVRCHTSADEGQTWSKGALIYANTINWDQGYPCTVQIPEDGRLITAFYTNNIPYDYTNNITGIQRAIYYEDYLQ